MFDLVAKTTFWSFTSLSDFSSTSKMNLLPWTSMCPRTGRTGRAWSRTGSPFPPSALLATQSWKMSQIWKIFLCKPIGGLRHIFLRFINHLTFSNSACHFLPHLILEVDNLSEELPFVLTWSGLARVYDYGQLPPLPRQNTKQVNINM